MKVVVDHLRGHRRGDRDIFEAAERISFGRHPQNDVAFHPQADIDASSRHAELCWHGENYALRDVGSSNGTYIDGELIDERSIPPDQFLLLDLGAGGPRVRLWIGSGEPPPPATSRPGSGRRRLVAGAAAMLALGIALWLAF